MSLYPCDLHRRRVPGSLEAAYPTLLRGGARYSRKMRLCSEHLDSLLGSFGQGLVLVSGNDSELELSMCSACGQETREGSSRDPFFCTVYRRGSERADYFASLCERCGDTLIDTLSLSL